MNLTKKLIFAPFFLLVLGILTVQLNPLFRSYDFIFSLSPTTLLQLVTLTGLILLSSFSFVLFASLAGGWKIVLPVSILGSAIPFLLTQSALGMILSVGVLVSLLLTYLAVENTLKSYLNFEPASLFGPSIRHLSTILILVVSLTYFLSISQVIQQAGFQIPDSLIDQALKLTPLPEETNQPQKQSVQPQLNKEQVDLLKQNPDLLKQYGLDSPQNLLTDTLKQTIKEQLQNIIKPYLGIIPAILAVLLFLILQSIISILNLLIYPLLWVTFLILEKTGFVKFVVEQRSVKKLIV